MIKAKRWSYWLSLVLAVITVPMDFLLKEWVIRNMQMHEQRDLIPGILGLFRTENTGAAFGIFPNATWILAIISGLVLIGLLIAFYLKRIVTHPLAVISAGLICCGAAGNLIDRIRFGYVVDMFEFLFVNFAIFNLADVFVTLGGIGLVVYLIFFYTDPKATTGEGNHD